MKATGTESAHMAPTLSRAHFNSASTLRSARDNSLDVITEEQELLITQLPDISYSAPPRLRHVREFISRLHVARGSAWEVAWRRGGALDGGWGGGGGEFGLSSRIDLG